jgi:hypothetical protein
MCLESLPVHLSVEYVNICKVLGHDDRKEVEKAAHMQYGSGRIPWPMPRSNTNSNSLEAINRPLDILAYTT